MSKTDRSGVDHGSRPRDRGSIARTEDVDTQRAENQKKRREADARRRRYERRFKR